MVGQLTHLYHPTEGTGLHDTVFSGDFSYPCYTLMVSQVTNTFHSSERRVLHSVSCLIHSTEGRASYCALLSRGLLKPLFSFDCKLANPPNPFNLGESSPWCIPSDQSNQKSTSSMEYLICPSVLF